MTLQEKAQIVLDDDAILGHRSLMLYLEMSFRTGIPPNEVRDRIYAMANGEEVDDDTYVPRSIL